jgi:hypothetical protein
MIVDNAYVRYRSPIAWRRVSVTSFGFGVSSNASLMAGRLSEASVWRKDNSGAKPIEISWEGNQKSRYGVIAAAAKLYRSIFGGFVLGKFIVGTFAIMAWAFYVMSGGASFVPETRIAVIDAPQPNATGTQTTQLTEVTRPAVAIIPATAPTPAPTATQPPAAAEPMTAAIQTAPTFEGSSSGVTGIAPTFTSLSAPAPAAVGSADLSTLRDVAARAVNMRAGPDTSYDVLDTLPQGTQTEVVESDGNGWVRVRVVATGQMGWMAERLLTNG